MSVAVIPPSKLSIVNTKQKYFLDLEEIIKNSRYSPEINFIDAFYWGYLTCTYDKEAPAKLLEKIGTIVTCESEKIITTNDKYNLYVQQLQDPTASRSNDQCRRLHRQEIRKPFRPAKPRS